MSNPYEQFIDPQETDAPDEAALSDIAKMAEKQRAHESTKEPVAPVQEQEEEANPYEAFVPAKEEATEENPYAEFAPAEEKQEPSWLDEVKEDWRKAKETNLGAVDVPIAFLRNRLEGGLEKQVEGLREREKLWEARRQLAIKKQRGFATPEEQAAADELDKELSRKAMEDALNWGPGPIVAGGKVGKLTDMFKEMWAHGRMDVPKKVFLRAEEIIDKYEDKLVQRAAEGKPAHEAMQMTELDMGRTAQEIDDLLFLTGRELKYPDPEDAIKALAASNKATVEARELAEGGWVSDILKPVSTRLKEISEELHGVLRRFERDIRVQYHEAFSPLEPFFDRIESYGGKSQRQIQRALFSGEFDVVERFIKFDRKAKAAFDSAKPMLKSLIERQKKHGLKMNEVENYWPRVLKDTKKALKKLNVREQSLVMKAFQARKNQLGRELNEMEKSEVLHSTLFGGGRTSYAPGHLKSRKFEQIPEKYLDLYASPRQAMHYYLRDTILDLAKRDFLGKRLTRQKGTQNIDWESSLSKVLLKDHKLSKDSATFSEIKKLLHARMIEGEKSPYAFIQATRNLTYTGTLATLHAAATQLLDIGLSFARFGLMNSLKALVGRKHIKAADLGLRDASIELLHSPSATARWMERALKYSGFSRMDQFGKELHLNSSLRKYWKLSKTEKGRAIIEKKYGKAFGKELPQTIQDLRDKKMTENVKLLLWNELSDVQPISLLEMPLKYLQAPNGRIFYTLKSFTIRQFDTIMNDTVRMIKNGQVREGTKNLGKYAIFLSSVGVGVGAIKKWMNGEEVTVDEVPDMVVENTMKLFGASEFITSLAWSGMGGAAITKMVAPAPLSILDTIGSDIKDIVTDETQDGLKSTQYVPIVGKFMYYWMGPGLERINTKNKNKENRDMLDYDKERKEDRKRLKREMERD